VSSATTETTIATSRLLLTLCRRDCATRLTPEQFSLLRDERARNEFMALSVEHRVNGLALSRVEQSVHFESLPEPVRHEWRTQLKCLRRRAAGLEIERAHLFHTLDKVAPGALVLKGGALAGTVYPDPVDRDMADLDFLVSRQRLKPATRALLAAGYAMLDIPNVVWIYRRHHFHYAMVKGEALRVELHWGLERAVRAATPDPELFLRDATMRPDGIRVPAPEYTVLHFVLQSCHEGFSRLSRFVDIDRIIDSEPEFDWDRLIEIVRRSVLGEATATALQIASRLLDTPVPHRVMLELRPGPICRTHVAMFRPLESIFERQRPHGFDRVMRFWMLDDLSHRLAYVAALIAPVVTFPPTSASPGLAERLLRCAKLCWVQIGLYGRFLAAIVSARGRDQMRFWSRNAISSERR